MLNLLWKYVKHLYNLVKSKRFQNYFFFLLAFGLFLYAYPAEAKLEGGAGGGISIESSWEPTAQFANQTAGADPNTAPNMSSQSAHENLAKLNNAVGLLTGAEIYENSEEITQNPDIPAIYKYGISGVVEQNLYTLAYSQPRVPVSTHLAQQWVPNYEEKSLATYAAGYSFLNNSGITPLWNKSLTYSYILFILVLIVAGFMIMFRSKIGGQTAVTIYNTIPNIAINLILVTFSFAIVGLILNFSVMFTKLIGNFYYGNNWSNQAKFVSSPFALSQEEMQKYQQKAQRSAITRIPIIGTGKKILNVIRAIRNKDATELIEGTSIDLLITGFMVCVYIFASVKVYITLLKAYLIILVDTIISPLILTLSAIPGQASMRKNLLNRILRNTFTFPVVFFLINFPVYLDNQSTTFSFLPLSVGNWNTTATSNFMSNLVNATMAAALPLVCYFTAAEAPKMLMQIFPTEENKGMQAAVGGVQQSLSKVPFLKRLVPGQK